MIFALRKIPVLDLFIIGGNIPSYYPTTRLGEKISII